MQLRAHLTKADIARANLLLLTRSASTLKGIALITAIVGAFIYFARTPVTGGDWAVFVVSSVLGGLGGFAVSSLISLVWVLSNSTEKAGVTGEHTYELTEEGFRERTSQNDSLQRWAGMAMPIRSHQLILIRVNPYLFHVLPRRSFQDDRAYEACWNEVQRRVASAA